jgi:putative transposase
MDTHSLSHTRWKCQYHIVFIPKYRQKRLYGRVREDIREILRKLCEYKKVEIVNGAVCKDHINLNLIIPPKLSISELVGYLKGKSALMIYDKHPEQRSKWDKSFWARGYYVATVGTVTEEVIKKYIAEQEEYSRKEDKSGTAI